MSDQPPLPAAPVVASVKPWWLALIPDTRGWLAIGFFGLTAHILDLLAQTPNLGDNKLFFALAEGVVITGLIGGVVAFYYAASQKAADQ
jgi:hypothetical protein